MSGVKEREELLDAMLQQISAVGDAILDGADRDLMRFSEELAMDLTAASLVGDEAAIEEILAQTKLLAEKHRVRTNDSMWDFFIDATGASAHLLTTALRVAIKIL